jgi:hypothetical protein
MKRWNVLIERSGALRMFSNVHANVGERLEKFMERS